MLKKSFLFLFVLLLASGCVSSKKYKTALSEIENLNNTTLSLEQQLENAGEEYSILEKRFGKTTTEKKALADETVSLKKYIEKQEREHSLELLKIERERIEDIEEKEEELTQEMSEAQETYDSLISELKEEISEGEIAITQLKDKLSLNIVDRILFDSGSDKIKKNGREVLTRVAEILGRVSDREIRVEGHTDNVPIGYLLAKKFPSNWELSTARATTVVKYLQEAGLDPSLLSATGHSEYRPVASNDTPEEQAKNRRIEILLMHRDPVQ